MAHLSWKPAMSRSHYLKHLALLSFGKDKVVGFHHELGMICLPTGASQLLLRLDERPNRRRFL